MVVLACAGISDRAAAAGASDVNLVTQYSEYDGSINWIECGALSNGTNGCFGSGTLRGLKKPCSITEGSETAAISTTGQYFTSTPVYVLDAGNATGDQLTLNVYNESKNVQPNTVTTTFKLMAKIALPLIAGPTAICSMSANQSVLLAGTNLDPHAVNVTLKNLSVFQCGSFSPAVNVTAMTQNENGYIVIQYGSGENAAFFEVGPDGSVSEDGSGTPLLINPRTAVSLSAGTVNRFSVSHNSYHPTQE